MELNVGTFTMENDLLGISYILLCPKDDIKYHCLFCVFTMKKQMSISTDTNILKYRQSLF